MIWCQSSLFNMTWIFKTSVLNLSAPVGILIGAYILTQFLIFCLKCYFLYVLQWIIFLLIKEHIFLPEDCRFCSTSKSSTSPWGYHLLLWSPTPLPKVCLHFFPWLARRLFVFFVSFFKDSLCDSSFHSAEYLSWPFLIHYFKSQAFAIYGVKLRISAIS